MFPKEEDDAHKRGRGVDSVFVDQNYQTPPKHATLYCQVLTDDGLRLSVLTQYHGRWM